MEYLKDFLVQLFSGLVCWLITKWFDNWFDSK